MARTPEYERGETLVFPQRTAARKRVAELQKSGPFQQYAAQFEKEDDHRDKIINSGFSKADPHFIYLVNNRVEVVGSEFPEGVLPVNAVPLHPVPPQKTNFFSNAFSKLKKLFQKMIS